MRSKRIKEAEGMFVVLPIVTVWIYNTKDGLLLGAGGN